MKHIALVLVLFVAQLGSAQIPVLVGPVHTTGGRPTKYETSFYVMEVTPFDEVVVSTPDRVYHLHCKKALGDCDNLPSAGSTVLGRIFYHKTYPNYSKDGFVDLTYSPGPYPQFAHYTIFSTEKK